MSAAFDLERAASCLAKVDPEEYRSATPFPHLVRSGAFDEELLRQVYDEFPPEESDAWITYSDLTERGKQEGGAQLWGPHTRTLLDTLRDSAFVSQVERLTQISGLIPDTFGGGYHQSPNGARLEVHADFNVHPERGLYRRVNALLFLNSRWRPEWGGLLEFWDEGMSRAETTVVPEFNTFVLFTTAETTFHGHPQPVEGPPGTVRRSIAMYYYTETPSRHSHAGEHLTLFQTRPEIDPHPETV